MGWDKNEQTVHLRSLCPRNEYPLRYGYPWGDGLGCLPLEGKGDRLRWMRCSRNAALQGDEKRMLRILHLIRHVPCHLLLKEKASVAVPSWEQTKHLRNPTTAGASPRPTEWGASPSHLRMRYRGRGNPSPTIALDGILDNRRGGVSPPECNRGEDAPSVYQRPRYIAPPVRGGREGCSR